MFTKKRPSYKKEDLPHRTTHSSYIVHLDAWLSENADQLRSKRSSPCRHLRESTGVIPIGILVEKMQSSESKT
jgi:hypothetical protein